MRFLISLLVIIISLVLTGCSQRKSAIEADENLNVSKVETAVSEITANPTVPAEMDRDSVDMEQATEETEYELRETEQEAAFIYNTINSLLPEIDEININWIEAIRLEANNLSEFYKENALLFAELEPYLQGRDNIADYFKIRAHELTISEFQVDYRVKLNENSSMVYELGRFRTNMQEAFCYLIIWSLQDNTWLKELEAVARVDVQMDPVPEIETLRKKWVALANDQSAITLAEKTYSEDFVYYNRRIVYEGYDNLAQAYSYMNNSNYSVDLSKDICVMVKDNLAYEIGTWYAGGSGKYIILWKRHNNEWRIWLDSNW